MSTFDWNDTYKGDGTDTTPLDEQLLGDVLDLPPGKACDLGCGAGGNAIGLAQRGWTVTGIDGATLAIDSARHSAAACGVKVMFEVADIITWQPDDTYDLVISSYALPPRGPQRDAALATARAALAPGGTFVIGEWDAEGANWGVRDDFVTTDELTTALGDLQILKAESVAVAPHNHDGHPDHDHDIHDAGDQWQAVIVIARRPTNVAQPGS